MELSPVKILLSPVFSVVEHRIVEATGECYNYNKYIATQFYFYSVLSSSKSPLVTPLLPSLPCSGLVSGAVRTSLEGNEDGFMSVKFVSSLSNSSLPSSE